MIGIIVTGHGKFASGLLTSLNLIAGNQPNICDVDFLESDSTEILESNLKNAINNIIKCEHIIILSDLVGGSPFKVAAILSTQNKNITLLSGTNLGLILDLCFSRNNASDFEQLILESLNNAKKQLIKFSLDIKDKQKPEMEDGI